MTAPTLAAHSTAPWPYQLLDLADLHAQGWRPTPFRDFVLKVHQRCNLACDYCYVYTMADQSWRHRPAMMSTEVRDAVVRRIAEHADTHHLAHLRILLHGGEPLLAGLPHLLSFVAAIRTALPAYCRADNDRHRRHHDGRGSYQAVHRALTLLNDPRYVSAYAGLLCTIDPNVDPIACYEKLLEFAPPTIDFLLPHANWATPPRPGRDGTGTGTGTPYGDWLVAAFDRWYAAPVQETRIRLFEDLISLTLGGRSRSEQVGLSPVAVVVVETDGAVEQVDSLKSAYPGACSTGLNVLTDPFTAALAVPGVVARQIGREALCRSCLDCPVHRICGGGHYAHRYRPADGFRNPSVYCHDLRRLVDHVQGRVTADLSRLPAGSHR